MSLAIENELVPDASCYLNRELSATEQSKDPADQKNAATHHVFWYELVEESRASLFETKPEDLVKGVDAVMLCAVEVSESLETH
jgi:hypothetical protein